MVLGTDIENAMANNKDSSLQEKGQEAREIRGRLQNQETILKLTVVTDIYLLYGRLINIAQMYSILPHQRLDLFKAALDDWDAMTEHFEDHNCSGGDGCKLSTFHRAVASLNTDKKINNVFLLDKYPVQNAALNTKTRGQRRYEDVDDEIISQKVGALVQKFSRDLCSDLRTRAVKDKDVKIIELTRVILEFGSMIKEMRGLKLSPEIFAASYVTKFLTAAKKLKIPSIEDLEESFIEKQFRTFIKKLDSLYPEDDEDVCKIDPLAILTKLFSTKENHSFGIEVILHICGYSSLKSSCESILESFVSEYEYANDPRKNFHEESITDVYEICHNGPIMSKCEKIVDMALKSYAKDKKKLHFVTAKSFSKSEVIQRMEKETSGLIFMD